MNFFFFNAVKIKKPGFTEFIENFIKEKRLAVNQDFERFKKQYFNHKKAPFKKTISLSKTNEFYYTTKSSWSEEDAKKLYDLISEFLFKTEEWPKERVKMNYNGDKTVLEVEFVLE